MTAFPDIRAEFGAAYPDRPVKLRHLLCDNPVFELDRLLALAKNLPPDKIEYNSADLSLNCDPSAPAPNGLSLEQTIERIDDCGSWVVLKNVERDREFAALMEVCLGEIEPAARPATGPMHRKEAFVFISSPRAVTPFHMDPEHNILLQIRGDKKMTIYPHSDYVIAPPEKHEAFHAGGHRNMEHREAFDARAEIFDLKAGEAVYVPVKAPHHVRVGEQASVSFSITWRSRRSDAEARLHLMNAMLRRLGARPPLPGAAPARDRLKIFAHRVYGKLRAAAQKK